MCVCMRTGSLLDLNCASTLVKASSLVICDKWDPIFSALHTHTYTHITHYCHTYIHVQQLTWDPFCASDLRRTFSALPSLYLSLFEKQTTFKTLLSDTNIHTYIHTCINTHIACAYIEPIFRSSSNKLAKLVAFSFSLYNKTYGIRNTYSRHFNKIQIYIHTYIQIHTNTYMLYKSSFVTWRRFLRRGRWASRSSVRASRSSTLARPPTVRQEIRHIHSYIDSYIHIHTHIHTCIHMHLHLKPCRLVRRHRTSAQWLYVAHNGSRFSRFTFFSIRIVGQVHPWAIHFVAFNLNMFQYICIYVYVYVCMNGNVIFITLAYYFAFVCMYVYMYALVVCICMFVCMKVYLSSKLCDLLCELLLLKIHFLSP